MSVRVTSVDRADLEERRKAVLEHLGLTREELRVRAETYSLTGEEWEALTEVEEIEFLLEG